jgi:two-component system, OmpR family, heavy metal sensor histidine kinase CusS
MCWRTAPNRLNMKLFPKRWPISWRLTLLYAVSLFLLLTVAAGVLDWILVSDMRKDNDDLLAIEMQSLRVLLKEKPYDVLAWRSEIEREANSSVLGYARFYVRITDDQGKTIVEAPGMDSALNNAAFVDVTPARSKKLKTMKVRGSDGQTFVIASQRHTIFRPYGEKRIIQIALDRSRDDETIANFRQMTALVLLAGLVVSSSLGFLLTKAGLRPLTELTKVFMRISPENLNARIGSGKWPPEIEDLGNSFDLMLQRLEQSFVLQTNFSADLAHEIRTPINNLRGEAEVALGRARTADEYRRVIESSLEEFERLSRVVDNILFLARADARTTVARLSPVNVRQEVDAIMEYFEALAEEKEIGYSITGNSLLKADGVLLRRAITNILSNALHYTPCGGRIEVTIKGNESFTDISISDTGIGIDQASLSKVQNRFFRTEKARSMNSQGSGLGLAIVKSIMELHGGSIEIESAVDKGSTVRLRFPH